jgi:DNA (cytosine-5)-methyltransferase 1
MSREIFIDYFAGGGGASQGIKLATGRSPDIAVNHDPDALAMYAANHRGRGVKIVLDDVFSVNLRKLVRGRPVGGFWASPDCRDFSRAKGGQPVSRRVRGLAWSVIKVAKQVRPRVIFLENVCEFEEWGPLIPRLACRGCDWKGTEGQATLVRKCRSCPRCSSRKLRDTGEFVRDPQRLGLTFKIWLGKLKALGYHVEYRKINACDHGAGTKRKRLCLIARCDGEPIVWPEPTHGPPEKCGQRTLFGPKLKPYRTAAEFLQWDIPCPSIFDRKKPLKPKSQWRVAKGLERYVLNNPRPFLVGLGGPQYAAKPQPVDQPAGAILQENHRAVVAPQIVPLTHNGERRCHPVNEPSPVITGAKRGELALSAMAVLKFYGGVVGHEVDKSLGAITAVDHHALLAATLLKFRGDSIGGDLRAPLPAITSGAGAARPAGAPHAMGIDAAWLVRFNHGSIHQAACDERNALTGMFHTGAVPRDYYDAQDGRPRLHWGICGGESGHHARPMHPDWARGLRDQCVAAGVPFFFKQWGEWAPVADGPDVGVFLRPDGIWGSRGEMKDGAAPMQRVGKKAAGRLLDGREWNEMPEVNRG